MKKVLHISKYYDPFIGGVEQVAKDVVGALAKDNSIEQKIICFNEDVLDEVYNCRRVETVKDVVDDIEVIRCGCFAKISSQSLSATYKKELDKLMSEFKPDIVIFHYPNPFVASLLLRHKKEEFKLIIYWHLDITKQKMLGKLFDNQNISLINRADKIVYTTPQYAEATKYKDIVGINKRYIIPNCIDNTKLQLTEKEKIASKAIKDKYADKVLAFFIGRHVPYKGLTYLIEASKLLGDADIQFVIAGQGELTESLKQQAKGDKKIQFVGRISDSQRRIYLDACDIFCFPSVTRNEAFGIALAEGMYYGKPAVTFTIKGSGVNYVNLNGVTGIECSNGDANAYAKALRKLIELPELRKQYGNAAKKRVEENFLSEQFNNNVKKLVND